MHHCCSGNEEGGSRHRRDVWPGHWGPPAGARLAGGSFGFQLGTQSTDVVMLVMNQRGLKRLLSDKFTIGAEASASVAGRPRRGSRHGPSDERGDHRLLPCTGHLRGRIPGWHGSTRRQGRERETLRKTFEDEGDHRGKCRKLLRPLACLHPCWKSTRQVALRFLVRQPAVFAIPKASSPEHSAENAGAGDLRLSDAELARIDKAFPPGPPPRELPTL